MNTSTLPRIIGILGRSRSGKDTIANIIKDKYQEYEICRFAQPIKNALKEIYGFTFDQLENDFKESIDQRYGITPREAMQEMTSFYLTKHGPSFFSDKVFSLVSDNLSTNVIIPDVRYSHDIVQIRKRGGIIIKVIRPEVSIKHTVENHIGDLESDYTIINDADIIHLENKVYDILTKLIETNKTRCF
jgi:dephospho-CoA kinase